MAKGDGLIAEDCARILKIQNSVRRSVAGLRGPPKMVGRLLLSGWPDRMPFPRPRPIREGRLVVGLRRRRAFSPADSAILCLPSIRLCWFVRVVAADPRRRTRAESTPAHNVGLAVHFSVGAERPPTAAMDTPTIEDTLSMAVADASLPIETVGTPLQLGRFSIERMLGEGGYSRVYLARDEELGRSVALKVPKAERFQSEKALADFFQEARTVAGLDHPNIVRVYDVGHDSLTGIRYIVMQHVEGDSLDVRIAEGQLPYAETVGIVRKVALALHAAHKRQFFHRDIKPSNILLADDGEPYLADFGLAVDEQGQVNRAGEFAGTVPYMAPEQVRGETHQLDGRADIWSLGVVLYRMLTGRTPFRGKREQLVAEILEREVRPPRQIDETIPKELERICLRCLRKPINERYSSAFDLAEELEAWQVSESHVSQTLWPAPESATAQPVVAGTASQAKGTWGRGWTAVGLILLAVAAGTVAMTLTSNLPKWPTDSKDDLPPATNGNIDAWAIRGVWCDLLRASPVEIDPPPERDRNLWSWVHVAERLEVEANIPDEALIELGATRSEQYRLQVTINKANWDGEAGIFWGYQRIDSGKVLAEWQAVTIQGFPDGGKTKVRIHHEIYRREHAERHRSPCPK